uniref:Uncharacterized protein LOC114330089 n=1 Tax=Diabrotica virgifera virgifera TaxID=50390 RepID=A0A6P7FH07_DIAVI
MSFKKFTSKLMHFLNDTLIVYRQGPYKIQFKQISLQYLFSVKYFEDIMTRLNDTLLLRLFYKIGGYLGIFYLGNSSILTTVLILAPITVGVISNYLFISGVLTRRDSLKPIYYILGALIRLIFHTLSYIFACRDKDISNEMLTHVQILDREFPHTVDMKQQVITIIILILLPLSSFLNNFVKLNNPFWSYAYSIFFMLTRLKIAVLVVFTWQIRNFLYKRYIVLGQTLLVLTCKDSQNKFRYSKSIVRVKLKVLQLYRISVIYNKIAGQMILMTTSSCYNLLTGYFHRALYTDSNDSDGSLKQFLFYALTSFTTWLYLVVIIICLDSIVKTTRRFLQKCVYVHGIINDSNTDNLVKTAKILIPKFSAAGFINIDRSALLLMFFEVSTFLMILLQFKIGK